MKYLISFMLFAVISASSAFITWCGGYNFDHRSEEVGAWVGLTMYCAGAAAFLTWLHLKDSERK